ncbi:MAG: 4a-hydroxytetrahydrobiopterin dehydratase [Candidatus Buchananbacteria bacterium]
MVKNQENSDWKIENGKLVKEFKFADFKEAVEFVNKVATEAEKMNHHPDILIHSYNHVKVTLFTHAMGAITTTDNQLAEKINQL